MITQETEKKKKGKPTNKATDKKTKIRVLPPLNIWQAPFPAGNIVGDRESPGSCILVPRFAYLSSYLHEVGCWVKGSSVEKTSLPLKSAGYDKAILSRGSSAAHGAKEKAGSSPQLSSKTVLCLSFPISQTVQRLPLHWMEEDPIIDTVLPHPHWGGTLPSPRSQGQAIRLV